METPTVASQPAPGWFPDPWNPSGLRWWDGAEWTAHVAGGWQAPGLGAAAPVDHTMDWIAPVNRDGFAIAAGYLALFSLFLNPFTSVAALVCGIVALKRI